MMEQKNVILSAKDVEIQFSLRGKKLNAIRKCSLDLYEGETLAIVGESADAEIQSQPPTQTAEKSFPAMQP